MEQVKQKYKVILLIPSYNGSRNWEVFSEWLYRLNPLPDYFVFIENNSRDNTLENLVNFKLPHQVIRIWLREDLNTYLEAERWEYANIGHIRQLLLTIAKQLDPDYAIFIDDDTLPPHDLITKFTQTGKDIVGGCYYRIFPEGMFLATKFYHIEEKCRRNRQFLLCSIEWMRNNIGKHPYYVEKHYLNGDLVEVPMTSGGCLCLSRRALQHPQLYFYPEPAKGIFDGKASEDFGYCLRARRMGIRTYLHLGIVCRHLIDIRDCRSWAIDTNGNVVPFKW